jgi:triphosphoribosyl-dephospho-CoA synthase
VRSIQETRKVVDTNTNLGIVLLLAPLASVPLEEPLEPGVKRVLSQTTVEDSRNVYAAIRLAKPGGLGKVPEQDVQDEPTLPLRDVMALARVRDLIAAQYAMDFVYILSNVASWFVRCAEGVQNVERAIIETQLRLLRIHGDDLVGRKLGRAEALKIIVRAGDVTNSPGIDTPQGQKAFLAFDAFMRSDNHARNPGTTADLIAAALFVALREKRIPLTMPFVWEEHPFQSA